MLIMPKSLSIERNEKAEAKLVDETKAWLEKDSKDRTGIHASDLLDPRKAYFDKRFPQPLNRRMVGLFFVGKVLHAFFLSALNGEDGVNWKSDMGSTVDPELKISYSNDWEKNGIPYEFKTSRSKYEQKNADLTLYCEQLLIYMVAKKSTTGRLVVLQTSLPAPRGEGWGTYPQYRAYTIRCSQADLDKYKAQIVKTRKALEKALKTKSHKGLELCRKFKCGEGNCPHWERCKPEGRYGKA